MSHFHRADEIDLSDQALHIAAWGTPKSGKTTFAVGSARSNVAHWPTPIYYLNYDQSLYELLRFVDPDLRKALNVVDLIPSKAVMTEADVARLLEKAEAAALEARTAILGEGRGTIVFDTASAHWKNIQTVELAGAKRNKDGKPYQYEYGNANRRFASLMAALCGTPNLNLLLLHHAKAVYDAGGKVVPGEFEPIDSPQTEQLFPIVLQVWGREERPGEVTHGVTFNYVRNNESLRGLSMENVDYVGIHELLYGGE